MCDSENLESSLPEWCRALRAEKLEQELMASIEAKDLLRAENRSLNEKLTTLAIRLRKVELENLELRDQLLARGRTKGFAGHEEMDVLHHRAEEKRRRQQKRVKDVVFRGWRASWTRRRRNRTAIGKERLVSVGHRLIVLCCVLRAASA